MAKILISMLEAGAGHKMPANAVKYSLEELFPGRFEVEVVDFFKAIGCEKEDQFFKEYWDWNLAHVGYARMSYLFGELIHPLTRAYLPVIQPRAVKKAVEFLADYRPDMVFSTHYFCLQASRIARDRIRKQGQKGFIAGGFITDPFEAYSWWCERKADFLLVSSERAENRARWHGVPQKIITTVPFPVHNRFLQVNRSPDTIREELGINPRYLTILTSAGGQGIGKIGRYVQEMAIKGEPLNIIAVCGRNETLRQHLEKISGNLPSRTRLIPLGFVNNMNELLSVSDVCIAKAGASTTFEALFLHVPIIFTDWVNYAEKPNIDYCVKNQVGWYAPSDRTFWNILHTIQSTDVLKGYRMRLKKLQLRSGSDDIARFLAERLT